MRTTAKMATRPTKKYAARQTQTPSEFRIWDDVIVRADGTTVPVEELPRIFEVTEEAPADVIDETPAEMIVRIYMAETAAGTSKREAYRLAGHAIRNKFGAKMLHNVAATYPSSMRAMLRRVKPY